MQRKLISELTYYKHVHKLAVLFLFIFFFISPKTSFAFYVPPPLFEMIGRAALVVYGTISSVNEETFILSINEVVIGDFTDESIEIKKFKNWTCASRWTDYGVGQDVLVFLYKFPDTKNPDKFYWKIMSGGGEGEMPIKDNYLYYSGIPIMNESQKQIFEVQGGKLYGERFEFDEFLDAVKNYKNCYVFKMKLIKRFYRIVDIEQLCDENELESYKNTSVIHAKLIADTIEYKNNRLFKVVNE